ncbi:hypothetical protein D1007_26465 [Hordeum vulgare]|nr:hypothetical protein D1007_26465 [Hordeum vulgare]
METPGAGFGGGRGFGGRGGFGCRKRRNDNEAAGLAFHPPMSKGRREAMRKHDAKFSKTGAWAWDNFCRLDNIFDLALQCRRDGELV